MGVRLHIVLPESVHRAAKRMAESEGVTLKAYATRALQHEAAAGLAAQAKAPARPPRTTSSTVARRR